MPTKPAALENLKKCSKRDATADDYGNVFLEITGKSDRAAIIVSGSRLDDTLAWAIECVCRPLTQKERGEIFNDRGPIASFSSRILMADALGLLTENEVKSLQAVRFIRNECAHCQKTMSLQIPELKHVLYRVFIDFHSDSFIRNLTDKQLMQKFIDHCLDIENSVIQKAKARSLDVRQRPLLHTPIT